EYTIENQTAIGNSSWANVASSPKTVTLTLNATGVVLKVIKGSKIVCGAAAGNTVTGSLTGTVLVKGFQDESGNEGFQQEIDIG
ncbi:MAG: hypothetical protein JWO14_1357, partial [Solirubrobacterales bacterium]|nr:hypothetical protein [Solirubrobacterales bacterium]